MTLGLVRRHPCSRPGREQRRPAAASRARLYAGGIAAIIAAVSYSSFLLSPWTHPRPAASSGFVSELEDPGQPFSWLYRGSDILAGFGVLTAVWALRRVAAGRRPAVGVFLLAVTGASSMLDAAASMSCDPATSGRCAQHEHTASGLIGQLLALHTDSGLLGFLASAAGAALLGAALTGRWPGWGRIQLVLGTGIASCGLADLVLLLLSDTIGTTERIRVLLTSGWFLIVGLFLLRQARQAPREPRVSGGVDPARPALYTDRGQCPEGASAGRTEGGPRAGTTARSFSSSASPPTDLLDLGGACRGRLGSPS